MNDLRGGGLFKEVSVSGTCLEDFTNAAFSALWNNHLTRATIALTLRKVDHENQVVKTVSLSKCYLETFTSAETMSDDTLQFSFYPAPGCEITNS
ncbi:hypothetical protein FACS189454_08670 [Planctomycetales bacterium]|nr:hypothetical protein FACS189454_08670 [Planctomycetales bacterium]